jgi:hypothetical protein
LPKDGGTCSSNEVTVGCIQACDCPGSEVCCASENGVTAQSQCQAVPAGGQCQATSNGAAAQFCKYTSECVNGAACIPQTCALGANLNFCGLQSQAPFNCTVRDAGAD